MRYISGGYSKLTFKSEDSVEIDNSEHVDCKFNDCELIGEGLNWRTKRPTFIGQAAARVLVLMQAGRGPVEIM